MSRQKEQRSRDERAQMCSVLEAAPQSSNRHRVVEQRESESFVPPAGSRNNVTSEVPPVRNPNFSFRGERVSLIAAWGQRIGCPPRASVGLLLDARSI